MHLTTFILFASIISVGLTLKNIEGYQMIAYSKKSKAFGSHTTVFNSMSAHVDSIDMNVKVVVIGSTEFTEDNVKNVVKSKASALLVVLGEGHFVPSRKWHLAYDYLVENKANLAVYFIENNKDSLNLLKEAKNEENLKLISSSKLGKLHSKLRFQDIIGEIRDPELSRSLDSTLLISGIDSFYGSTEKIINFPETGAGLLAHIAINRGLYYLTQQYRDYRHNIISYYSTTKYNKFASVDQFLKSNDHSHFTTGIEQVVIFNRITSSNNLKVKVHNVKEDASLEFTYLDDLYKIAEQYGIKVDVEFVETTYFQQFADTTIVIEDAYDENEFNIDGFLSKVNLLQDFFISKTFNINSDKFNEMLKNEINSEEFVKNYFEHLSQTLRSPERIIKGSSTFNDIKETVSIYFRKSMDYDFAVKSWFFHQGKQTSLTIAKAKPALFDLGFFMLLIIFLIVLNLGCGIVGYSSSSDRTHKKNK